VVRPVRTVRIVLATYVIRVVDNGGTDGAVAGHVEAVETGANAVFRDGAELLTFLRRDPSEWAAHAVDDIREDNR
jgi:hypothetical protein